VQDPVLKSEERARRHRPERALLLLVASIALGGLPVAATATAAPIRLRSRIIDPVLSAGIARDPAGAARSPMPEHVLVQLAELPDAVERGALARAGLDLGGAIPERAFLATLRPGADLDQLRALGVTWIGELTASDKVAPGLSAALAAARGGTAGARELLPGLTPDGQAVVYVEWHRDVTESEAMIAIQDVAPARPVASLPLIGGALMAVPLERVSDLAALDQVKWLEAASPALTELNNGIRIATGVDQVFAAPLSLDGQGVRGLIYDGGLACGTHPDLVGRVILGEGGAYATHATHVAGTFGGSGATGSGLYRGMAPAAGIVSYAYESCSPMCLYNNPQDMAEDYTDGINHHAADFASNSIGANIAANGYDCSLLGDYEYTARLIDAIACGGLGRPFLSFWAAGNERQGSARCGSGFRTTGVPAAAKNAIVIGATLTDGPGIASFSSLGPVDDGRMRPDLVAPGCETGGDHGITSLKSCTGTTVLCGTSMATPAVAGIAALVKERLRARPEGDVTLPATIKAILGVSATDLGNVGPDYTFGYGQVDARAAIEVVDAGMIFEDTVSPGEVLSQWLDVPSGRPRLRVLLAWDDPPAEPLTSVNLVNDLDLVLMDPMGGVHRPFVLDPTDPAHPAVAGTNHRDPSELVEVSQPVPGRWRIEVHGSSVPMGPQTFGVAADAPPSVQVAVYETPAPSPSGFELAPNVPNPFNPSTVIRFQVAGEGSVKVAVYDLRGAEVRVLVQGALGPGRHEVVWDGRDQSGHRVASGVYRCALLSGSVRLSQPMVLLK
jgi:subtilisin family serine protease